MKKRNSLSRIILGLLFLLVVFIIVTPIILKRLVDRIPKVNTPPVGNNMEIQGSGNSGLDQVPGPNSDIHTYVFRSQNGDNTSGELNIQKVEDRWSINISANLPSLEKGYYQIWLVRTQPFSALSLGQILEEKGGWFADFTSTTDLKAYQEVWISKQVKESKTPEVVVLKASL